MGNEAHLFAFMSHLPDVIQVTALKSCLCYKLDLESTGRILYLWSEKHILKEIKSLVPSAAHIFPRIFSWVNLILLQPDLCICDCSNICCSSQRFRTEHFPFHFSIPDQQTKSKAFLCVCGNKWWCEMNGKRDSLMIMRRLIFLEYPVRAQPIGCQIKAPVSMTKCSPFSSASATVD